MKTNDLVQIDDKVYRVLHIEHERILVIDCVNRQMPVWISTNEVKALEIISETDVAESITPHIPYDELTQEERRVAHERYTIIAPIIAFITDDQKKKELIALAAEKNEITKATVRTYLKTYLTYQKIEALAPTRKSVSKELSPDEKNFRWALNKFYYTQHKNTLKTAYILMLKERYTDSVGKLTEHPSLSQFRYFYRKTKHIQNELITRKGLSNYQRNSRPLLGTVQDYAPAVGYGLLDSTICDIYLVNNSSQLVGRPILTLCVDAYSSLVCGYLLSWEGGTFSLQGLLQNVITDKTQWCSRFGIIIEKDDWPCKSLPGILVTDRGPEYTSQTFAQVTELGVQIENLEAFRPDRKGVIEKALDCIQQLYIPLIRGKGVVEKDYQERGIHDYRKDARLTIDDLEKIIIRCIIHYNSKRVLENFEYSIDMIHDNVPPYANALWSYSCSRPGANLIDVTPEILRLTLLPRTKGVFARNGLTVNGLRYRHRGGGYTEKYLSGDTAVVAYDPDSTSTVWLYQKGEYFPFDLILQNYGSMTFDEADNLRRCQREIKNCEKDNATQSMIDLSSHIEAIVNSRKPTNNIKLKDIRKTHKTEKIKRRMKGN